MKKSIFAILMLTCGIAAAQNWTTVTATNITDLNQQKLAAGQICFLATDQNDNPISVGIGGGGQVLKRGYCSAVAAGAVTSFTVPNPANTLPTGVYYRVTVKDSSTGQEVLRYAQVSFAGATFNFDNYAPLNLGTPAPLSGNSVTGNLSVTGNVAATGTVTGSNLPPGTVVTGSGTTNRITKFTNGASGIIGNSGLSDDGTTVSTSENVTAGRINNIIYVDGTKYPMTQAGIQSAFTDACAIGAENGLTGTDVYLPVGQAITVSNTTGQQFLVTCPLHVHGPGPNAFWFVIANTVQNTVPLFRVKPPVADQGFYEFDNFRVTSGGSFGGDAIFLDGTSGGINQIRVHDLIVNGLDNSSWSINMNTAGGTDRFFLGHVYDNSFTHGMQLNSSSTADSWLIDHNTFGSVAGNTLPCINATTEAGASHITAFNNNGGCAGGFFISHGTTECKILYNQIEQPIASTEANSAIIDLLGDTYSIDACEISGNNIGSNNLATTEIRVGAATNTIIRGNVLGIKATTGIGVVLTAASSGTKIDGTNEFIGVGGGAIAMTNASGANPFATSLPTLTNTLPAAIQNDTVGGMTLCTNAGKCWQIFGASGTLFSPAGLAIGFNGASTGTSLTAAPLNAGGTFTLLDINSGPVAKAQVASDVTLAGNTSLQTITGLSFSVLANAVNYSFHCSIDYSQATAAVSDAFGIQVATNAPTNVRASGIVYTSSAASTTGVLSTLSTTTATNIVTFTPSATGTLFTAVLNGTIELPATAHTINFMASQSNAGDLLTIKRGSYCQLF